MHTTSAPSSLSPLAANLICMGSMVAWALGLPAAQQLIGAVPALPLTAGRMLLAAAALVPIWALMEGGPALRGAGWRRGAVIGGATFGLAAWLLVLGQARTNEVTVAVISASLPVVGLALEVAFDGRKLTLALIAGVVLSLIGGVVALGSGAGTLDFGTGALLCLASVILYAFGSRWTVTAFPALSPLGATAITVTGAALATGLAAGVQLAIGGAQPDWAAFGWSGFGYLVVYGVVGMALCQVLWIVSVGHLGIGVAALHMNAAPFYVMLILFAAGAAWNNLQALGAAVVGAGVLIAQGVLPLRRR